MTSVLTFIEPSLSSPRMVQVSDLRQWTYCPRVIWWTQVCPVAKLVSFKMKKGLAKEQRLHALQKRRTLRTFGVDQGKLYRNLPLDSKRLGLTGKLDMLLQNGEERYPIEVKFTHGEARLNHKLQLAGYALLLEEHFGKTVQCGYVLRLPDDTIDKIEIDEPLRKLATETIEAIRSTLVSERVPVANPILGRCVDCEYRLYCGDIDVAGNLGKFRKPSRY